MRKGIFLAVLAMAAVGALALAGAGSAAKPATGASAVPRAASIHVGASLVRQVGARNYAGPNCPGRGWNCTTATRVLQVATAGGTNVGVCTGGSVVVAGPNQTCSISQLGGSSNTARCTESSTDPAAVQSCSILQTGDANYAFVNQSISQSAPQTDGITQSGAQTATITQGPAAVTNQLQVTQNVQQSIKTNASTQTQIAGQSLSVNQSTTGSGTNFAGLTQSEGQKAYARGTTQNQNTSANLPDCDTDNPPPAPNVCANVVQTSEDGTNENHLRQSVSEDENATGIATQKQGSVDSLGTPNGGIDARVHQGTTGGSSFNDVNQSKSQHETSAGGSQTQHDPMSCCGFGSQAGGSGNVEDINQSASLSAGPGANQTSDLIGTSVTPDGTCNISQKASINVDSASNSDTFSPCPAVTLETSCSGGSEGGDCTAIPPVFGVPDSILTLSVQDLQTGSTTNASPGDTLEYTILYTNSGTGPAHNVSVGGYGAIPSGTTLVNAIPIGDSFTSFICPQTVTSATCTLGPTADPGTVAPDTLEVFRTVMFTVSVPSTCGSISYTASGHTDEEGTLSSTPKSVFIDNPNCIG